LSRPASVDETVPIGRFTATVATSPDQPPLRALEAYDRAASVIDQADATCHLSWSLLAAVGAVESDHGRSGGSRLNHDGVARPAVLGARLTGRHGFARVVDSDRGAVDGDRSLDRAVGPMQLLPSTWAVVAVDADGDGVRDPQDIDDASLAAAVLLCGGHEDLGQDAGRRAALLAYNHSETYVDRVLDVMQGYDAGLPESGPAVSSVVSLRTLGAPAAPDVAEDADDPQHQPEWQPEPHHTWLPPFTTEAETLTDRPFHHSR
jgi:membrane-bound lytic murein transglycosylase B